MTQRDPNAPNTGVPEPERFDESKIQYDSALKPLLWLLLPFVAMLIYGVFGG